jgi:Amt family ammonium transporter
VVAFLAYKITDIVIGLRVTKKKSAKALDETQHGERAYNM